MKNRRKFSIFISSTYEDLKKERQALVGVALENNFIPVGNGAIPCCTYKSMECYNKND